MTTQSKHTPGPYRSGAEGPKTTDIIAGHNCIVARVIQDGLPPENVDLFAAAPTMLAALEEQTAIVEWALTLLADNADALAALNQRVTETLGRKIGLVPALQRAVDTIAQARGRS